jgi:hypothetical protein
MEIRHARGSQVLLDRIAWPLKREPSLGCRPLEAARHRSFRSTRLSRSQPSSSNSGAASSGQGATRARKRAHYRKTRSFCSSVVMRPFWSLIRESKCRTIGAGQPRPQRHHNWLDCQGAFDTSIAIRSGGVSRRAAPVHFTPRLSGGSQRFLEGFPRFLLFRAKDQQPAAGGANSRSLTP